MIRYTLKLECKAYQIKKKVDRIDGIITGRRSASRGWGYPWVARITDYHYRWRFAREFVHPVVDKSEANSVESRGVYYYWHLGDGIYESCTDSGRRELFAIHDGARREVTVEEVETWLAKLSLGRQS